MPRVTLDPSPFQAPEGSVRDFSLDGSGALRTAAAAAVSAIATTDTSGAVAAGTNVALLPANVARGLLIISNTGANPMMLRFGSAATATFGHPIAAGASVVLDAKCPTGSVNLFSANGTTAHVTAG